MCNWSSASKKISSELGVSNASYNTKIIQDILIKSRMRYLFHDDTMHISSQYQKFIDVLKNKKIIKLDDFSGDKIYLLRYFRLIRFLGFGVFLSLITQSFRFKKFKFEWININ